MHVANPYAEEDPYTEFRVYECPLCHRLWVVIAASDPVNSDEHDYYIHRNILGVVHFAHHTMPRQPQQGRICGTRPQRVYDRPDVLAAYHLGGAVAVDMMGGRSAEP